MVVIEFAKSDRATCRTCNQFIDKDVMKLGTTVSNFDSRYLSVEWHHEECFWKKRSSQYFKRKGKKNNVLLKLSQFSNQHLLDEDGVAKLTQNILDCNLKFGTPAALVKAGIEKPVEDKADDIVVASKKRRAASDADGPKKKKKSK